MFDPLYTHFRYGIVNSKDCDSSESLAAKVVKLPVIPFSKEDYKKSDNELMMLLDNPKIPHKIDSKVHNDIFDSDDYYDDYYYETHKNYKRFID